MLLPRILSGIITFVGGYAIGFDPSEFVYVGYSWTIAAMLIVISQLIVAYLIELFGIFGAEKADFSWRKMIGMAVAIAGVVLFKWE